MARTKRTESTSWMNETPIQDIHEALYTFRLGNSSSSPMYLAKREKDAGDGYEIVLPWYHEGSSGGDSWGVNYFQIDAAVAEELIRERLVAPMQIKHWGYTDTRNDQFVSTQLGLEKGRTYDNELEEKAVSMLTPGIHTDLAGKPKRLGRSRDGYRCGRFYVDFELPIGGKIRVFPETQQIVEIEMAKSA